MKQMGAASRKKLNIALLILLLAARELWLGVQAIRRDGWRFRAPEDREKSG